MSGTTTTAGTVMRCVGWRKSHPDTMRWRAYYAAFEARHGRPSTDDEFDYNLSQIVGKVMSVVHNELEGLCA